MKKSLFILFALSIGLSVFSQKRMPPMKTANDILNETYCSGLFSTAEGTYFDLLDGPPIGGYSNILSWLQGRVAGLTISASRNQELVPYIRNQRAAVYVDEIRWEPESLSALSTSDIAMIKVIKGPFLGNFGGSGGTIAIYTILSDED